MERIRTLFAAGDRVGDFVRETLTATIEYAARVAPDVAHSPDDVDRVLRWGFGWQLGPFEIADVLGIAGAPAGRHGLAPPAAAALQLLRSARERSAIVRRNAGASLVDLGDGVLCVEFIRR
jgi:3-hydroxyacyl-CoA dehydrogenase